MFTLDLVHLQSTGTDIEGELHTAAWPWGLAFWEICILRSLVLHFLKAPKIHAPFCNVHNYSVRFCINLR